MFLFALSASLKVTPSWKGSRELSGKLDMVLIETSTRFAVRMNGVCVNVFNAPQSFLFQYILYTHLTTSEGDVDLCEQVRVPPQYLAESKITNQWEFKKQFVETQFILAAVAGGFKLTNFITKVKSKPNLSTVG